MGGQAFQLDLEEYMAPCIVPDRMNFAWYLCDRWVEAGMGDRPALFYMDQRITFRELQEQANRFGNLLKALGLSKGASFIIRSTNSPQIVISAIGGWKIGAVPVLVSPLFRSRELEHICQSSASIAAFCSPESLEPLISVRERCPSLKELVLYGAGDGKHASWLDLMKKSSPNLETLATIGSDRALILYTSGSTGMPKGVCHTHRSVLGLHPVSKVCMRMKPNDVSYGTMHMSFIYGFMIALSCALYAGASCVIHPGRVDPHAVLRNMERYGVTIFLSVPSVYRMILGVEGAEGTYELSSLRLFHSAAEPLPAPVSLELKRRFNVEVYEFLGQSECIEILGYWPEVDKGIKPGSTGKPIPLYNRVVSIVDDDGKPCPTGTIGHLVINDKDLALFTEYLGAPGAWEKCHRHGWYYLGDLAYMDDDGYFWYVSRADDLIKSRGYLISPKEVEDVISEVEGVAGACVIGIQDSERGQRVKAFVKIRDGYSPNRSLAEKIVEHTKSVIAPYKAPRIVEFVAELPTTATGKVARRELRMSSASSGEEKPNLFTF